MIDSTCSICQKRYEYNRHKGHTRTKCNSCHANNRRFVVKRRCVDYKGGECEICGYNKCLRALAFHHIDETTKLFTISGSHGRSWKSLKAELDKCVLVCHNCHMEIHDGIHELNPPK